MKIKPFRFECTACGQCCLWEGRVCLYPDDIRTLAAFLQLSVQAFVDTYTNHIGVAYDYEGETLVVPYLELKKKPEGGCIFLEEGKCAVHDAKPMFCAASPLVAEVVFDENGWRWFTEQCKGYGQGELYDETAIEEALMSQARFDMEYESELEKRNWNLAKWLGVELPEIEILEDYGVTVEEEEL